MRRDTAAAQKVEGSPMRQDAAAEGNTMPPPPWRGSSVDSPRLNAEGKVVFQSLERSLSSPSTFNGGLQVNLRRDFFFSQSQVKKIFKKNLLKRGVAA